MGMIFLYYHTGVGFGVARFDYKSNARASKGGMSNKTDSHASFVYSQKQKLLTTWL